MKIANSKYLRPNIIVFRKWSRCKYAIFNTLHKIVNIAHLGVDVVSAIGTKIKSSLNFQLLLKLSSNNEDDASVPIDDIELLTDLQLQAIFVSQTTPQSGVCDCPQYLYKKIFPPKLILLFIALLITLNGAIPHLV